MGAAARGHAAARLSLLADRINARRRRDRPAELGPHRALILAYADVLAGADPDPRDRAAVESRSLIARRLSVLLTPDEDQAVTLMDRGL